ncbi:MAG: hypothetical protein JEZ12_23550 [Desulfobacterium sp.]|nr:hypothetical protein [Desulfobacterium sp.]
MLWQDIRTQLRAGGMGIIGLDYAEARQGARDLNLTWSRGLKRKMQAMERELLSVQSRSRTDDR